MQTTGVDGYATVAGIEHGGTASGKGAFGFRIQVQMERELTEGEKDALLQVTDLLDNAFIKGNHEVDPQVHLKAMKDRAEILGCFEFHGIYVEEIPNGYCSRGCCAFYPWFIVTTRIGRIKIGWRKRVIHLEWTDSAIKKTAKEIFPKEEAWPGYETTQYDKVIHAHSYEAATKYIKRLFEAAE